ncbi:MAG: 1-deoxy-D-xylulose-5-phosphate reductoisomerase [Planctomycetota bacterium]
MSSPRRLVILGATGTVGVQALQILQDSASPLEVVALSCHSRAEQLSSAGPEQAKRFLTSLEEDHDALLAFLRDGEYEICLNAVVGAAGLPYTEAVLQAGRTLAVANKESLVMAGSLLMDLAHQTGASIVPVDSEHSAIHQCLLGSDHGDIRNLYLTASGGALRDTPPSELPAVTPTQALDHPNWDMGPRITIDSATMMNKAFEIVEARFLFDVSAADIQVLVHRQSVVHSMVEFHDGSMLAQLGPPDMSLPIHYALHFPDRLPSPLRGFDPKLFMQLTFEEPDAERYPALALGWKAATLGGDAGAILNAADEVAVEAFLGGRIPFPRITELCDATLQHLAGSPIPDLGAVLNADRRARDFVADLLTTTNCS